MNIADFDYELPDERIARFPVEKRDGSKLLVWRGSGQGCGYANQGPGIVEATFGDIGDFLPKGSLLVFNNTRVVRARLVMHKPAAAVGAGATLAPGARVEVLCLEPHDPADYERAFAARGSCEWVCMVGNAKKWKSGPVEIGGEDGTVLLRAWRVAPEDVSGAVGDPASRTQDLGSPDPTRGEPTSLQANSEQVVRFEWDGGASFGEVLECLGRMPIPPYLGRDTEEIDLTRYQTVYSRHEGSVAAPTAGLHFTPELIDRLGAAGVGEEELAAAVETDEVTLHVGAGTFLPVKVEDALDHPMHVEHFEVRLSTLEHIATKLRSGARVIAVGTTSVRTLESLPVMAWRVATAAATATAAVAAKPVVGQFEANEIPTGFSGPEALEILIKYLKDNNLGKLTADTRIMITPGFRFRIVGGLITNFHQPHSTLLLLVSAFTGGRWREIYDHALSHEFRFLSYGDSSLLLP